MFYAWPGSAVAWRHIAALSAEIEYFVTIRLDDGGASPGAAGEMANVSQAFQPSGLFCPANSA